MPSPQSRLALFYYGHLQNRFWKILAAVFGEEPGSTIDAKKQFLLSHHIALWDVLHSCDINGASDSSIRNPVPNDFAPLFAAAPIRAVYMTGKTAWNLYRKFCAPLYQLPFFYLPSPSPANCTISFERITAEYRKTLGGI